MDTEFQYLEVGDIVEVLAPLNCNGKFNVSPADLSKGGDMGKVIKYYPEIRQVQVEFTLLFTGPKYNEQEIGYAVASQNDFKIVRPK